MSQEQVSPHGQPRTDGTAILDQEHRSESSNFAEALSRQVVDTLTQQYLDVLRTGLSCGTLEEPAVVDFHRTIAAQRLVEVTTRLLNALSRANLFPHQKIDQKFVVLMYAHTDNTPTHSDGKTVFTDETVEQPRISLEQALENIDKAMDLGGTYYIRPEHKADIKTKLKAMVAEFNRPENQAKRVESKYTLSLGPSGFTDGEMHAEHRRYFSNSILAIYEKIKEVSAGWVTINREGLALGDINESNNITLILDAPVNRSPARIRTRLEKGAELNPHALGLEYTAHLEKITHDQLVAVCEAQLEPSIDATLSDDQHKYVPDEHFATAVKILDIAKSVVPAAFKLDSTAELAALHFYPVKDYVAPVKQVNSERGKEDAGAEQVAEEAGAGKAAERAVEIPMGRVVDVESALELTPLAEAAQSVLRQQAERIQSQLALSLDMYNRGVETWLNSMKPYARENAQAILAQLRHSNTANALQDMFTQLTTHLADTVPIVYQPQVVTERGEIIIQYHNSPGDIEKVTQQLLSLMLPEQAAVAVTRPEQPITQSLAVNNISHQLQVDVSLIAPELPRVSIAASPEDNQGVHDSVVATLAQVKDGLLDRANRTQTVSADLEHATTQLMDGQVPRVAVDLGTGPTELYQQLISEASAQRLQLQEERGQWYLVDTLAVAVAPVDVPAHAPERPEQQQKLTAITELVPAPDNLPELSQDKIDLIRILTTFNMALGGLDNTGRNAKSLVEGVQAVANSGENPLSLDVALILLNQESLDVVHQLQQLLPTFLDAQVHFNLTMTPPPPMLLLEINTDMNRIRREEQERVQEFNIAWGQITSPDDFGELVTGLTTLGKFDQLFIHKTTRDGKEVTSFRTATDALNQLTRQDFFQALIAGDITEWGRLFYGKVNQGSGGKLVTGDAFISNELQFNPKAVSGVNATPPVWKFREIVTRLSNKIQPQYELIRDLQKVKTAAEFLAVFTQYASQRGTIEFYGPDLVHHPVVLTVTRDQVQNIRNKVEAHSLTATTVSQYEESGQDIPELDFKSRLIALLKKEILVDQGMAQQALVKSERAAAPERVDNSAAEQWAELLVNDVGDESMRPVMRQAVQMVLESTDLAVNLTHADINQRLRFFYAYISQLRTIAQQHPDIDLEGREPSITRNIELARVAQYELIKPGVDPRTVSLTEVPRVLGLRAVLMTCRDGSNIQRFLDIYTTDQQRAQQENRQAAAKNAASERVTEEQPEKGSGFNLLSWFKRGK